MFTRISPAIKGLLTALVMIGLTLLYDANKSSMDPRWQYLVYLIYAAGISWTLLDFRRQGPGKNNFAAFFGQGFRCFIITTIVMVAFTAVYLKRHPELAAQEATVTREYYIRQGDKTPPEIDEIARKAKKQYPLAVISLSIFRYLIIGAVLSAAGSALLTRRQ